MSYTLVLEWMPGDLYMSAVTARCTAPTSSYSVVWLPPNKVYQITLYCGSTSLVSFLVGAFRGKAWSYMSISLDNEEQVETVAVLSRKSATKTFIPVTVSPKDMGLDEAKAQPTYENIRKYVKETHGLTVSTLNIAQMKAECGLEMECDRSGGKQQPKCPPEKREAILDAFRHFGMIEDDSSEG